MSKGDLVKFEESIRDRIFSIRGFQVMLDSDLAELYGVETKYLNRVMKRNSERFPSSFCFQLDESELNSLRCQFVTIKNEGRGHHRKYLPYVFTQEGVAMLSAVLRSETAVRISIMIIEAFIAMRKFIQANGQVFQRLDRVEVKLLENDQKFGEQYFQIEVGTINSIHDRFIIIDDRIVYHFGASLKDLGKKLFAFTKMDKVGLQVIEKIK